MALMLLRHTRPEGAEGLCYGRLDLLPDPGLDAEAARLVRELPPFARVLTSPLVRCLRLAEALAAARDRPLAVDPRLAEMDFGHWEGRAWASIGRADLDVWAADLLHARPHGGETVAELAARSRAALAEAARGPVPALVVTHAGVIKAALAARDGSRGWEASPGFGEWMGFDAGVLGNG